MAMKKLFGWTAKQKTSVEQLNVRYTTQEVCMDGFVYIGEGASKTTVMAVGKPRNGKSSVLNNIFNLSLEAGVSVKMVTQKVSVTDTQREGKLFQVIDTPGLGALEISDEETLDAMKCATRDTGFTLMYCFSISPNTLLDETDKAIIRQLHTSLGEEIWKNCVLLLTFSDLAFEEIDSEELYVEHVRSHAREFQGLLQSVWQESPAVRSVFDENGKEGVEHEIIAIPVKKRKKPSSSILPGLLNDRQDWTDFVISKVLKLSEIT